MFDISCLIRVTPGTLHHCLCRKPPSVWSAIKQGCCFSLSLPSLWPQHIALYVALAVSEQFTVCILVG